MKKKTLLVISTLSFALAGGCFYMATLYLDSLVQEKLFAKVVKVAQGRQIAPYQPITREDVALVQEEADELQTGSFQRLEDVVGKMSIQTMFSGEQVLTQKLRDHYLLPVKGYGRYEFPLSIMMPVTELRRGDLVKVWVRYKSQAELQTMPAPAHFKKTDPSVDLLFESQLVTVKDSNGSEVYTIKPQLMPDAKEMNQTFFQGSQPKKNNDAEKRYWDYRSQPSALPAFIGLNLNDQQYAMLTEASQYGTIQIGHITVSKEGKSS
ncbi:SAF domain-containing protein [Brevibacillus dissolubilis]|uniref:SAF domain-containing protein n=1 Tax=Brevibacillus dissolubilis TaxID=1844116 RepID=UPI001115EB64|nr:SAF domain-containing protein [Brevibacillus dissolubilis]